jgi:hypothetical protein
MINTSFGAFNGTSWEALCQQVFKRKYEANGYQHIPPSPGDFGLEGFCSATGLGFQCYCPDKHYTQKELYEHQRDKVTRDLNKLKTYAPQLATILSNTQLSVWRFVTPEIASNDLILHARAKEKEVRSWGLPFLTSDFTIELHDAEYYMLEINEIRIAAGEGIDFSSTPAVLAELIAPQEVYEENVMRKTSARLAAKSNSPRYADLVSNLHKQTLDSFLESDGYFRQIEKTAPVLYFKMSRLINEFEHYVQEQAITYVGTPQELTENVRQGLENRLTKLGTEVTEATAATIARHMVARWLAICSLDYD